VGDLVEVPVRWPAPARGWPTWLWSVPFTGSHHPGAKDRWPIEAGANCQRYAYEVLALFGHRIDDLRSSQLWADTHTTSRVGAGDLAPLDLVLFNASGDPYSAHVGLVMAADEVLHLSGEVGHPAVWSLADFAARPRYATLLGAKRPISSVSPPRTAGRPGDHAMTEADGGAVLPGGRFVRPVRRGDEVHRIAGRGAGNVHALLDSEVVSDPADTLPAGGAHGTSEG